MSEIQDKFTIDELKRLDAVKQEWESGRLNEDIPSEKEKVAAEDRPIESDVSPLSMAAFATNPLGFTASALGGATAETVAHHFFPDHPLIQHIAGIAGTFAGGIRKAGLVSLPAATGTPIELTKEAAEDPTGAEYLREAFEDATNKAQRLLNASGSKELDQKLGFFDKVKQATGSISTALINAQLMNPRITAEKAMTDAANIQAQVGFKALGTAIQYGPTAGLKTAYAGMAAQREAFRDALRYAATSFGRDEPAFQKSIGLDKEGIYAVEHFDESPTAHALRWIGSAYGAGSRAVMSADQFSKAIAWRAQGWMNAYGEAFEKANEQGLSGAAWHQFADQYAAHAVNNMSDALFDKTAQDTWRTTFTDQSKLVQDLTRIVDNHPWARILVPYVRTPMNLIKEGFTYSPLSPLTESFRNDVTNGSVDRNIAVAKSAVGSGMMSLIAYETAKGNITGDGPQGRGREFWPGKDHPNSINVPGIGWTSYKYLGPFAQAMSMAADSVEMYHMSKDPAEQDKILDTSLTMMKHFTDSTPFLETFSNITNALASGSEGGGHKALNEFLGREASGFIPAPIRIAAHIDDPAIHKASTALDQIKENIPFYSQSVPLKYDVFGNVQYPPVALHDGELTTAFGRTVNQLSPLPVYGTSKTDPVEQEFAKHGISFNQIPDHLGVGQGADPVGLNPQYQAEWAQSMNQPLFQDQNLHDYLQSQISSDVYQHSPDWKQVQTLHQTVTGFRDVAKTQLIQNHPDIQDSMQQNRDAAIEKINQAAGTP